MRWLCAVPSELNTSHVLVAASRQKDGMLYLVGVARGDVNRVMLTGVDPGSSQLYRRSKTWGQFALGIQAAASARLLVYGHGRLLETLPIGLRRGEQRVLR